MEITKSTIECYKLRSKENSLWADITIDSLGNTGRVQIASDYGSWQYYWGSCGESFKKFLTGLNISYVAGKFGENSWFDLPSTITNLRSSIISENYPEIDKDDYDMEDSEEKESYEEEVKYRQSQIDETIEPDLKRLSSAGSENEFVDIWYRCEKLSDYIERPDMVHRISPLFERFWKEIWLVFIVELQNENTKDIVSAEN